MKLRKKQNKSKTKESSLYRAINASYKDHSTREKALKSEGYVYDKELSNDNQQIYYNAEKQKVINTVAGTHNLRDVITDGYIITGGLKHTSRYREADRVLKKAKEKYSPKETTVIGHSLGGTIASDIGGAEDKIITYNSGASFGKTIRKNETSIHTTGDPISFLGESNHRLKFTLDNPHSTKHLKKEHVPL